MTAMSGVVAGTSRRLDTGKDDPSGEAQGRPPGRPRSLLTRRNQHVLRFGGALLLLACALLSVWRHIESLATGPIRSSLAFIPDDAFYYLKIARNIADGLGPTFDGTSPTNGYHPGWMAILAVLARVVEDPVLFVRTAQWAGFVLHVLTAVLFGRLLWGLGWRSWAILCAALWMGAPWGLVQAAQGMEAPLYQFCAVLLLLMHLRVNAAASDGIPMSARLWYGVTLGAVVLARTDGGLLSALSLALTAWRWHQQGERSVRLAWPAVAAVAVVLPWLIYSVATCGTVLQDSAVMKALWRAHGATLNQEPASALDVISGAWFAFPLAMLFGGMLHPWLVVPAKAIVAAVGILGWRSREVARDVRDLVMLAVAWALGTGLLYASGIADLQLWHFVPPAIALFMIVALLAPAAAGRRADGVPALIVVALVSATSLWVTIESSGRGLAPYPWQVDVYDSTMLFDGQLPEDAVVGAFNAGIPGYFSTRRVVNLDGLVNHDVVQFWRNGSWDEYVRIRQVTHVADELQSLRRARAFSRHELQLEEFASHRMREWPGGCRFLWTVRSTSRRDLANTTLSLHPSTQRRD